MNKTNYIPKILNIITVPDDTLRKISENVDGSIIKTPEFQDFLKDLKLTMKKKDGVGLAAPQIGKNIRVFTVNTKNGAIAIINPRIVKRSVLKEWGEEGCLSVPGTYGEVKRHKRIEVEYLDENGKTSKTEASGLLARIFQHENDHLDGILFTDKAKKIIYPEKQRAS